MTQKAKVSEVLVVAALIGFAYWRYSKMSAGEKQKIHDDIKDIGEKVIRELVPEGIKSFLPSILNK